MVGKKLSKKEIALVEVLRTNGREKILPVAKKLGIPKSTLFDSLHRMEKKGILNHKSLIDFEKIGYLTRIVVVVKTPFVERGKLKNYLSRCENVNNLHVINNGYDFMFEGVFKNLKDSGDFISKMEEENMIQEKQVFSIVEDILREKFLCGENVNDENNMEEIDF